jgi:GNAT superfamily N-acetyltransferase
VTLTVIEPVDPLDEQALRAWFDLECAAHAFDRPDDAPPCWTMQRARLSAPAPGRALHGWLARSPDGEVVGAATLGLPMLDNTDNASGEILVEPHARRRGLGRRLLAVLAEQARSAGRDRLGGEALRPLDGPSPGSLFAAAIGAHLALVDIRSRLALPGIDARARKRPFDEHEIARTRLAARRPAAGYDLVQWTAATPDEWTGDIARLTARMSIDAPNGDLHLAPEVFDADRIRELDGMCRARGIRKIVTAARGPDGTLAAFTEIGVAATVPEFAANWSTLVEPERRGHGLGLRIKLANLALVRQQFPRVRRVDTYNAATNSHMIAINEAMGFRPLDLLDEYELELTPPAS